MRTPVRKNHQLASRTDLSGTKSIQAESLCFPHLAVGRLPNTVVGSAFKFGHYATEGIATIITSLVRAFSDGFLS